MPKDVFEHHVTTEKNDFANWIKHVYTEDDLAKEISTKKDTHEIKKVLKKAKKTTSI